MARNTKTSKKAAASANSPKKAPAPSGASSASAASPQAPAEQTANANNDAPRTGYQATSWRFKLFLFVIPLTQMLWNAEAPRRPFSAVRDPTTGLPISELVNPKILLVTAEPGDLAMFAPTVGPMLEAPRNDTAEFYAVSLQKGNEDEQQGWEDAWTLLGLEEGRRDVLDVALGSNKEWDPDAIASSVQPYILKYNIDTILTYDNTTGSAQHTAVLNGLSLLLTSPTFKQALLTPRTPDGTAYAPRIMTLRTPPPTRNFSVLSPIVEHIMMAVRAMTFDAVKAKAEGLRVTTFFVSDVWKYVKAWRVLLCFPSQRGPVELLMWILSRGLWVNEWKEV